MDKVAIEAIGNQIPEWQLKLLIVFQVRANQSEATNLLLDLKDSPAHLPHFFLLFARNVVLGIQLRRCPPVAIELILS